MANPVSSVLFISSIIIYLIHPITGDEFGWAESTEWYGYKQIEGLPSSTIGASWFGVPHISDIYINKIDIRFSPWPNGLIFALRVYGTDGGWYDFNDALKLDGDLRPGFMDSVSVNDGECISIVSVIHSPQQVHGLQFGTTDSQFSEGWGVLQVDPTMTQTDIVHGDKLCLSHISIVYGTYEEKFSPSDPISPREQYIRATQFHFIQKPPTPPTKSPSGPPIKSPTSVPTKSPTAFPTKPPTALPTKPPTKSPIKIPSTVLISGGGGIGGGLIAYKMVPQDSSADGDMIEMNGQIQEVNPEYPGNVGDSITISGTGSLSAGTLVMDHIHEITVAGAVISQAVTTTLTAEGHASPPSQSNPSPEMQPTPKPTTNNPTTAPTIKPTTTPTNNPTTAPTIKPTNKPTTAPTNNPTAAPILCVYLKPHDVSVEGEYKLKPRDANGNNRWEQDKCWVWDSVCNSAIELDVSDPDHHKWVLKDGDVVKFECLTATASPDTCDWNDPNLKIAKNLDTESCRKETSQTTG